MHSQKLEPINLDLKLGSPLLFLDSVDQINENDAECIGAFVAKKYSAANCVAGDAVHLFAIVNN